MLTDRQRAILEFEEAWAGRRIPQSEIRERFGVLFARYYQELLAAVNEPEAVREFPLLVNRLVRLHIRRRHDRHRTLGVRSATPSATPGSIDLVAS